MGAFLDDYACLIDALIELYQATFSEARIDQAAELADMVIQDFADAQSGGFFYTAADQQTPITRIKDSQDGATPSGNGMLATALLKLSVLTGRSDFFAAAESVLMALDSQLRKSPMSGGQSLIAIDHLLSSMTDVVIQSNADVDQSEMLAVVNRHFLPGVVVAWRSVRAGELQSGSGLLEPLFEGRGAPESGETAWVCQTSGCLEPVSTAEHLLEQLNSLQPPAAAL